MTTGLKGKVAMVTGGATGLGAAILERLAEEGARVACCYNKSASSAEALVEKVGGNVHAVKLDVTKREEVERAVAEVAEHFGDTIDILVNNAGDVIGAAPIEEMDVETWNLVLAINLTGAFLCTKYCVPGMKAKGAGRIVNMSSISAHSGGGPGCCHYAASKAGVESFTRSMAKELGPHNINVNAVSPGVVYTPMHERTNTPENLEKLRQLIPLFRMGDPKEVAGVVAFLASDDASYVNGEIIAINGGMRMD
ncbi:MAG: SDR family NAD(P)-dependent oxidoreductase [Armatimonadota bacterium]